MDKSRKEIKIYTIEATFFLLLVTFIPSVSSVIQKPDEFILPGWGGGMVHSDPYLSDYINLPVPKDNVKIVWKQNYLLGEKSGNRGNGIAGNGKIAACTFGSLSGRDNLIVYDYNGKRLYKSNDLLNFWAQTSTPMVDIYNRIIACDNQKILKVDVDKNKDGEFEWSTNLDEGGLPLSPTITENGVIILPTYYGPIYAFDSITGIKLNSIYLGVDEIINNSKYNAKKNSNTFYDNKIFLASKNNPNYLFDFTNKFLGFINNIYEKKGFSFDGYYSTINSICVNKNRFYILAVYFVNGWLATFKYKSRLYAIDINRDVSGDVTFDLKWRYDFTGLSQASPTFIDGTIYFDVYQPHLFNPQLENPYIYAVTDYGDNYSVKWIKSCNHQAWFSFSYDPRHGFWYLDKPDMKLYHYDLNGKLIENNTISIPELINESIWNPIIKKFELVKYFPLSVMNICGYEENLTMIVSANLFGYKNYVIGIDLLNNNSLLWKVEVSSNLRKYNYAGGQFTILRDIDNSNPRIVFCAYWGGIIAIGNQ